MSIQPKEVPLHLMTIETSTGGWLIDVTSVAETQGGDTLHLKLTLETAIDEYGERIRTRSVSAFRLVDQNLLADLREQVRRWIEATEGDGFLELLNH